MLTESGEIIRTWKTEFPDYDGEFHLPKGWEDNSWHNDTCPHISKRVEHPDLEIEVNVWQDYVNPDKREYGDEYERYVFEVYVHGHDYDYTVMWRRTDNWNEIERLMEGVGI